MDRLGVELAGLAEEAAAGAHAAGAAAARRRGARRRRRQAAATLLSIVGLVAGAVWLDRWTVSPAPPSAPATSAPRTPLRWEPFDPKDAPGLQPRGKPVLITQRTFAGRPYRLWAFQATLAQKRGSQICVALQNPGGGGSTGCDPAGWPAGIGASMIGDQVQLLHGHVSKRAQLVRLHLARAGVPLPPMVVRPLSGGPRLPVNI
jgi:hypothetical protein